MTMPSEIAEVLAGTRQWCVVTGDAEAILPTVPDNAVDLVATDPPYMNLKGGTIHRTTTGVSEKHADSKSVGDPWGATLAWCPEAWRVCELGLVSFCLWHFVDDLAQAFPRESRVCLATWYKRNSPLPVNNVPRFTVEYLWAFKKKPGLRWSAWQTTMWDVPNISAGCVSTGERLVDGSGKAIHPSQKPLELMERILAIGGDVVLDPFCGVGTTGVASRILGRRFIGIEIDPAYAETARRRIASTPAPLFAPEAPAPQQQEMYSKERT
jgi:modification methylase